MSQAVMSSFCFVVKFGNPKISFCIFMKSYIIALAYSEFIYHHWERTAAIGLFISVPWVIFRLAGIKGGISSTPGVFKSRPLGQWWQWQRQTNNATLLNLIIRAGTHGDFNFWIFAKVWLFCHQMPFVEYQMKMYYSCK